MVRLIFIDLVEDSLFLMSDAMMYCFLSSAEQGLHSSGGDLLSRLQRASD